MITDALVGTGMETKAAVDSGNVWFANSGNDGRCSSNKLFIKKMTMPYAIHITSDLEATSQLFTIKSVFKGSNG